MDVSYMDTELAGVLVLTPTQTPKPTPDKKPTLWFTGMISCMSSVLSLFGRENILDDYGDEAFYIKPEKIIESKCIGEGAQGKVHLATLKTNAGDRAVAIKYVHEIDDITARHLRRINHENIVKIVGVCINPPKSLIVMELCDNGSLYEYMRKGNEISPGQMMDWARGIASGMKHLHDNKIVHRDLKSPNVLITHNMAAKVSDFGTSRTYETNAMNTFTGTVNWMAPEVIRAESYSEKIDVWSFGVVFWELVTLQIPYVTMEQHAIMWAVGTDLVSLPIPMGVPNSIHVLLVQCWNRVYVQRPSFSEVIRSLDYIAEELARCEGRTFLERQKVWSKEAKESLEKVQLSSEELVRKKIPTYTQLDLLSYRDLKERLYALNVRMEATNDLFWEVCSIRLILEMKERELAKKEQLVNLCQCGMRRLLNIYKGQSSTSDTLSMIYQYRAHLIHVPNSKLFVNLVKDKAVTSAVTECNCVDKAKSKKTPKDESKKDTVVQANGSVGVKTSSHRKSKQTQDTITAV